MAEIVKICPVRGRITPVIELHRLESEDEYVPCTGHVEQREEESETELPAAKRPGRFCDRVFVRGRGTLGLLRIWSRAHRTHTHFCPWHCYNKNLRTTNQKTRFQGNILDRFLTSSSIQRKDSKIISNSVCILVHSLLHSVSFSLENQICISLSHYMASATSFSAHWSRPSRKDYTLLTLTPQSQDLFKKSFLTWFFYRLYGRTGLANTRPVLLIIVFLLYLYVFTMIL